MAVHLYSLFTVERERIELLLNSSALVRVLNVY